MRMVRVRLPSVALTTVLALAIQRDAEFQMSGDGGSNTISFEPDDDNTIVTMWGPDDE